MKSLFVFCVFIAVAFALDEEIVKEMRAAFMENLKKCTTEENASPDDVASLEHHTVPATPEGKCVIFCLHKIYKIQDETGAIDREGSHQLMDIIKDLDADIHGKMVTVFEKCADVPSGGNPCDTAANFVNCAITEAKAVGLEEDFLP
uniref:OBP7 n=1 Tax=Hycleus phaleratus TaxID=1248972 RepID=A0A2U9NK78_9CUCU|nr:OBP7 [Hycleus phaleratus]